LKETVNEIQYLPTEQLGLTAEMRRVIYDIYIATENGKRYIIEMQIGAQKYFAERIAYYLSVSLVKQAPNRGKKTKTNVEGKTIAKSWDFNIAGICVIAILNFILFKEKFAKKIIVERIRFIREQAQVYCIDMIRMITVELPKFNKPITATSSLLDKWLYLLRNMEKLTTYPEEFFEEEFVELFEEARIDKLTPENMKEYNDSVLRYDEIDFVVEYAVEQAVEQALEKERKKSEKERKQERKKLEKEREKSDKALINAVKLMYKQNISIKEISDATGFTRERVLEIVEKD
jgi:predicted transposase/invertase (TIGR01784 family)